MPQKPKSASGASRSEFAELKREVAEMKPMVADNRHRIEALEQSDKEIKEEQVRANRQFTEMTSKFDKFVEAQNRANDELKKTTSDLMESSRKADKALDTLLLAFGLKGGAGGETDLFRDAFFVRDARKGAEERDKTVKAALYGGLAVAVMFLLACGGVWYVSTGHTPAGAVVEQAR